MPFLRAFGPSCVVPYGLTLLRQQPIAVRQKTPESSKHLGTVAAVDGNSLTLERRDGQRITVQVNAETRFKGGSASLADVQPGMQVLVAAYPDSNGTWTAVLVGSRNAPQGNNTP